MHSHVMEIPQPNYEISVGKGAPSLKKLSMPRLSWNTIDPEVKGQIGWAEGGTLRVPTLVWVEVSQGGQTFGHQG